MLDFTVFLVLCTAIGRQASLYFFFFAPFFSFFSFFLFVGTFFFFFPTDFLLPFNLAWNIWIFKSWSSVSTREKWRCHHWNEQECGSLSWGLACLFLLLPEESFFPLPTPENHRSELLVVQLSVSVQVASLARSREECNCLTALQLFGGKVLQFCNFSICGWPTWPEPAPAPQRCIAI